MVTKRTQKDDETPFLRADLSRNIFVQNKQKLMVAPVFLREGLLSEIRDRKMRRRATLRRWVSWTASLGFGSFLVVTGVRQSGLVVPLNVPVALEVPVPQVNEQKIALVEVTLSQGMMFPTSTPGATLENNVKLSLDKRVSALTIPLLTQSSGTHSLSLSFFRADGVLVASRILDITSNGQARPRPESLKRITSSLHAFALLLRPTLFTTRIVPYQEPQGRDFRSRLIP